MKGKNSDCESDNDSKDEKKDEMNANYRNIKNSSKYLDTENFGFIYANLEDYATLDGNLNGGYLIKSIKNVFSTKDIINYDLNNIVQLIRQETLKLVKNGNDKNPVVQIVEFRENFRWKVYFQISKRRSKH